MDVSGGRTVQQRCAQCGRVNRVDQARLTQQPVCGACHQGLFPSAPVVVTDATFADEVERSPLPVLVDFWAPWCGPCRTMGPVMDQLARERAGRAKVVKVNVDENPRLAARFGVQAIPTFLILKEGRVVQQLRGAVPKATLAAQLP